MKLSWHLRQSHRFAELSTDRVRVSVDVDRGGTLVELVELETGTNVLLTDPRGPAARERGGWYDMLPNAGPACEVDGARLTAHGDLRNLAWTVLDESDDPVPSLRVGVESRDLPLRVEKTISLRGSAVHLVQTVTNAGDDHVAFLWGHHVTLGGAFLEGATIAGGGSGFHAQTAFQPEHARVQPGVRATLSELLGSGSGSGSGRAAYPGAPASEMLFTSDVSDLPIRVRDRDGGLEVAVDWNATAHPSAWVWVENRGQQARPFDGDTVGLAIEPQVSAHPSLVRALERGTHRSLAPGESAMTWVTVSVERPDSQ